MTIQLLKSGQTLLDRYVVNRFIGEGGMQQVFQAKDRSFDRIVALKVPKNPSAEKRFQRSSEVSAKITHENVAKTLDYFEESESQFLVEEFIPGVDLEIALNSWFTYLDPHLAAQFVHRLARGLAAAHHAGVFHRDLKPSNIMIGENASLSLVKITDFGIAKMAEQELQEAVDGGESSITGSQTAVGTLPYMAPEMIDSPKDAGMPADIWALGAILYRLVAGDVPFGRGLKAIPTIMAAQCPNQPSIMNDKAQFSELGRGLWTIITATLQKNPASRPTADQLLDLCSSLCYADSDRFVATVESVAKGHGRYGFLRGDNQREYFYHEDSFYGPQSVENMKVLASAYPGSPHDRAFPVLPLKVLT